MLAEAGALGQAPGLTSGGRGRREGPQQQRRQQQQQQQRGAWRHLGLSGPGSLGWGGGHWRAGCGAPPSGLGPRTAGVGCGLVLRAEEAVAGRPWVSKQTKGLH